MVCGVTWKGRPHLAPPRRRSSSLKVTAEEDKFDGFPLSTLDEPSSHFDRKDSELKYHVPWKNVFGCLIAGAGVAVGILALSGCETAPPSVPGKSQTVQQTPAPSPDPAVRPLTAWPHVAERDSASLKHSKTPVRDTVQFAMDQHREMFPPNTEIQGITLTDGVATIDFSSEFNKITEMGDSNEGDVQRLLRRSLAVIKEIEMMRVTVDGHRFESQNTDWQTPFPVRSEQDSLQSGNDYQPAQNPPHQTRKRQNSPPIAPVALQQSSGASDTVKVAPELRKDNTPIQLRTH